MSEIAPGWYKDPADPTTQRYWDGEVWIGDPLPADATPPPGPPGGAASVPKRTSAEERPAGGATDPTADPSVGTPYRGDPTSDPTQSPDQPGYGAHPPAGWPGLPGWPPGSQPGSGGNGTNGGGAETHPGWQPPAPTWPPAGQTPGPGAPPTWPPQGSQQPGTQGGPPPGWPPQAWPPVGWSPPQSQPGQPGQHNEPGTPGPWAPPGAPGSRNAPPGWPAGYPYAMLPAPRPHGMALAPLGRRFAARVIDIVAVGVLSAILTSYLAYQWWQETSSYWHQIWNAAEATSRGAQVPNVSPTMSSRGTWLSVAIILLIMAIWLAYEVPNIASSGQTPGKRLMGIKVVGLESTNPIGLRRAMRRWVPLGFPMIIWTCGPLGVLVGALLQFYDCISPAINKPLQLARHDRNSLTVVVQVGTGPPTDGAGSGMANSGATNARPGNDGHRDTPSGG